MTELPEIIRQLQTQSTQLTRRAGQRDALRDRAARLVIEQTQLVQAAELLAQAGAVLSSVADERQDTVRHQIEAIVTRGLETVFGPGLSFHLVQATRGSATVIDFMVRTTFADGTTLDTPVTDARGGGVAAVIGYLLRVVILLLTQGHRRFLVLDETFAMLSAEYLPAMADFVAQLSKTAGVQTLMVTHQDEFAAHADTAYRFALDSDGKTKVTSG